jgi:hypothetical protein
MMKVEINDHCGKESCEFLLFHSLLRLLSSPTSRISKKDSDVKVAKSFDIEWYVKPKNDCQTITVRWLFWTLNRKTYRILSFEHQIKWMHISNDVQWLIPSQLDNEDRFRKLVLKRCPCFMTDQIEPLRQAILKDLKLSKK